MSARPFQSSSWYRVAKLQPKLREHITIGRHRYRGDGWYVAHDHATGRVHRLSSASSAIIGEMDGNRSVDQLWQEIGNRLGSEAPTQDELIQLLAQLNAADLLQTEATPDSAELFTRAMKVRRSEWLNNIFNPLALRVRIWHPDNFFERSLRYVKWLIGWRGLALWMLVVLPALVLAAQHWPELATNAAQRTLAVDNLLLMALSYTVLKTLHELGHGYAVKAFGGPVHELGVMFLVFAPVPYVDATAASEFRSKWRRALVGAAGMIVEVFVAALALYVWLAVEEGLVRTLAYDVMLIAGIATVLFNGNPLLRYDGYYILSDILEIPNLAQRATRYWGYLVERYVFRTEDFREFFATARRADMVAPLCASVLVVSCRGHACDRFFHRLRVSRRWYSDRRLGPLCGFAEANRQVAVARDCESPSPKQQDARCGDDVRLLAYGFGHPFSCPDPSLHHNRGGGLATG